MFGKVICILLLVALAQGEQEADIQEQIEKAQEEMKKRIEESKNDANKVGQKLLEDSSYLRKSLPKYLNEAREQASASHTSVDGSIMDHINRAIENNKKMKTLNCILKKGDEADSTINLSLSLYEKSTSSVVEQQAAGLDLLKAQLDIVFKHVQAGLTTLHDSLETCKDENCVRGISQRSVKVLEHLRNIFSEYQETGANVRQATNQNSVDQLRSLQENFKKTLDNANFGMAFC